MLGVCLVLPLLVLAGAVPVARETSFIGQGTNELASVLLQIHASQNENLVFSPLGVDALLAIFAEGSRGASRDEIASSLHLPADIQAVRQGYQTILRRLSEKNKPNMPEMRNWFYIYKNYTVDEGLKDILREYYLTEVKSVDRPEDFLHSQKTKVKVPAGLQGKPTDHLIDVDKEVESIIGSASSPHKSDGEEAASNQQPSLFDPVKKDEKTPEVVKQEDKEPENMSEVVKDKVEKDTHPEIKNEKVLPGSANSNERTQLSESERDGLQVTDEKKIPVPAVDELEKEKLPGKETEIVPIKEEEIVATKEEEVSPMKEDNEIKVNDKKKTQEEMMVAMQRSVKSVDDMSGMTDSAVKIKRNGSVSQMIVFNGLYFRGDWNTQFVKLPADDSRPFYKANNDKVFVSTLHAEGLFETADIPELKSRAVELQYEGGRYSLLLVVPKQRDGLQLLINDIADYPISQIYDKLSEKLLEVCLPTFDITTISKPLAASKDGLLNVKSIFNPESADLSGISNEPGLFVEELVQLVTFSVDSNYTIANFLTASVASSRSDLEKITVNQPFLFYLRDNVDGIIIVNGKVIDPTTSADEFSKVSLRKYVFP